MNRVRSWPRPTGRRNKLGPRRVSFFLAAVAALALTGCQEKAATSQKQLLRVRAVDATLTDYTPTISLTGVIAARIENPISFRTSGRMAERFVEVGDHVTPGMLLARIDPQEQESDIRSAQAAVDSAQAQVTQTTTTYQRQQTLLNQGFTTRKDYDQAEQAMRVAQSALQSAQTQLQNAKDALGYTELRAEKAGIITARSVETGQVVQAAQTIFTLAEDGDRDAVFNVDEALVASSIPDPQVMVTLLSDPRIKALGTVREVAPVIDSTSGTIRVKVTIPNTPPDMALGAAVAGSTTLRGAQAVLLPWEALFSDRGAPAVWTIDRATRAVTLTPVTVLTYNSGNVAISKGLANGQGVVAAGTQLLRPGQIVEIAQGSAP
ncbi:RND family efflux transporter MFP subunit [Beijerinckia sp. GAS462]|nr:RND family efflux transporter MFP subunit [Beijerinckia sp. GAS462]SEC40094.1 RND family efflux transporter, MFP subunit [Beijerinckia sp. 28-YEA-48]